MNKILKRYLDRFSLEQHLLFAILLGAFFRIIASYFIYTPLTLDDLGHSWLQAINMSKGIAMNLPEYRGPIIPSLLFLFIKLGAFFGFISEPIYKVYAMNLGLGLLSLLGILGAYYYCKACSTTNKYFSILIYLASLYAIMPLVSTRAGGECICLSFLFLGIGLLRSNKILPGFIFLGLAVLFRYQLGVIYLFYGLYGFKRKHLLYATLVGVCLLFIEAGLDLSYGRHIFSTLFAYVAENQKPYAKAAWYNLILFTMALAAFPFLCVMLNKLKVVYSAHKEAVIAMLIILVTHSMVPHKEERFILPILPFLFIFIAGLWSESVENVYAQRIFCPVFFGLNIIFLFIASFVPSQTGLVAPLLTANKVLLRPENSIMMNVELSKWGYGVYLKDSIKNVDYEPTLKIDNNIDTILVVSSSPNSLVEPKGFLCSDKKDYSSVTDRILYKLNPKYNNRRLGTSSLLCKRL